MHRRQRMVRKTPGIMLSPMIDMIFLLLVFFIVSSLNMMEIKTIPIKLPVAKNTVNVNNKNFTVTVKKDGSLYLDDTAIKRNQLISEAQKRQNADEDFAVLIRGEANAEYELVIKLMDDLKGAGVTRFGLATDVIGDKK